MVALKKSLDKTIETSIKTAATYLIYLNLLQCNHSLYRVGLVLTGN